WRVSFPIPFEVLYVVQNCLRAVPSQLRGPHAMCFTAVRQHCEKRHIGALRRQGVVEIVTEVDRRAGSGLAQQKIHAFRVRLQPLEVFHRNYPTKKTGDIKMIERMTEFFARSPCKKRQLRTRGPTLEHGARQKPLFTPDVSAPTASAPIKLLELRLHFRIR